ncbi:MAG: OsmC family protein [Gemmatimonadetes bacterium]|nr:OsmC family protein [Gemmatimonadota bacterium]
MRVDKEARITWTGSGMVFDGGPAGGPQVVVDGDAATGPSPMDLVLLGLAACMAIDVRMILEKSRVPLDGLDVYAEGTRAEEPPRRYTAVRLTYRVSGVDPSHRAKLDRAIELSRERYCSVLHSLREDLPLEIVLEGI